MAKNKHKKSFGCGHKGFGQKCRRCIDAERYISAANSTQNRDARRGALIAAARLKALQGAPVSVMDLEAVGFSREEAERIWQNESLMRPAPEPAPEEVVTEA